MFALFHYFQPDENTLQQFGLGSPNPLNDNCQNNNNSNKTNAVHRESRGSLNKKS